MSTTLPDPVQALMDHVDYQVAVRDKKLPGHEWSAADKEKRHKLMEAVVDALGLEPRAIQEKLGVNRTTWNRWENMVSAPNKSHLHHLRRLHETRHSNAPILPASPTLPRPLDFLAASPFTFSRLRVLFGHSAYSWKDAVFHFRTPFDDPNTTVDMASLALNGCRIIYIVKASVLAGRNPWQEQFVRALVSALGEDLAAQVLLSLCIIKDTEEHFSNSPDFGILNFLTEEAEKVGYIWKGTPDSKKPDDSATDVYIPVSASDRTFKLLNDRYYHTLDQARTLIEKQLSDGPHEDGKFGSGKPYLTISVLTPGAATPDELKIYY